MDVINTENFVRFNDFVDPAAMTFQIPTEAATTTMNQPDIYEDGKHHQDYYQMESPSSTESVFETNNVMNMGNIFGQVPRDNHQIGSYPTESSMYEWKNDGWIMKESYNFDSVENEFQQMQYPLSSWSSVTPNTFEERQTEYHQMQIPSLNGQGSDDMVERFTNGEVQQGYHHTESSSWMGIDTDKSTEEDQIWRCDHDQCGRIFSKKGYLASHVQSHSASKPYVCELCDKTFRTTGYLKQHIDAIHNADRLFQCQKCKKRFRTEDECNKHYEKHSAKGPFGCVDCDKSFYYQTDLRRHSRKHTKELFFCEDCGKGFGRMCHLKNHHQRSHLERRKPRKVSGKKH